MDLSIEWSATGLYTRAAPFLIFINDLDEEIVSKLLKFADDTKVAGAVWNESDVRKLQADLNRLYQWSVDWQMLFNVDKCKTIHFGFNNRKASYIMGNKVLEAVEEERDLGVLIHQSMKSSSQCAKVAKAANATLGMMKRTFITRNKTTLIQLYKALVRPKLEFCVQAWRPYLKRDIDLLEKVQRRATRLIFADEIMPCEDRLKCLNLTTLETRRTRSDLIEVFKIIKNLEDTNRDLYFKLSGTGLRGHSFKLFKPQARLYIS